MKSFGITYGRNCTASLVGISRTLRRGGVSGVTSRVCREKGGNREMGLILVSNPSSSNGAAFDGQLDVRLVTGKLGPCPVSLSGCFISQRGAPGSRGNSCSCRSLCTLSLRFFGGRLRSLLRKGRMRLPHFGFAAKEERFGNSGLGVSSGVVLVLRKVRTLGPRLAPRVPTRGGCGVCMSTLAAVLLSGRGCVPAASGHLLHHVVHSCGCHNCSTRRAVEE